MIRQGVPPQSQGVVRSILYGSVLIAGVALLARCGGSSDSGGPCTPPSGPVLSCEAQVPSVKASDVEAAIMGPVCNECHSPTGTAGAPFEWDTTAKLLSARGTNSGYSPLKVVDPGNLKTSTMYLKVLGGSPTYKGPNCENVGGAMPQTGAPLTDSQKALLKNWICGGAQP